jgi:hypothetical protein
VARFFVMAGFASGNGGGGGTPGFGLKHGSGFPEPRMDNPAIAWTCLKDLVLLSIPNV